MLHLTMIRLLTKILNEETVVKPKPKFGDGKKIKNCLVGGRRRLNCLVGSKQTP